jgi:hypothetical protein
MVSLISSGTALPYDGAPKRRFDLRCDEYVFEPRCAQAVEFGLPALAAQTMALIKAIGASIMKVGSQFAPAFAISSASTPGGVRPNGVNHVISRFSLS